MRCDECNRELVIGDFPWCPHGPMIPVSSGKDAYWDDNLQVMISNPGDRNKALRPYWENDHIVKIEPKERSSQYFRELNDRRRARAEKERKERA